MSTNEHEVLMGSTGNLPPLPAIDQDLDSDESVLITPGQGVQNSGSSETSRWQLATIVTAIKEAWFSRHDLQYIMNEVKAELRKLGTPSHSYDSDSSTVYQTETTTTNKRSHAQICRRATQCPDYDSMQPKQ